MQSSISENNSSVRTYLDSTPTPIELLARTAAGRPDHPAIEYLLDGNGSAPIKVTYAELLHEVKLAFSAFLSAGVGHDDGVAILLPFVPQAVSALIGATAAGVAFPMNLLLSSDAMRSQLALARTKVVVTMGPHPALDVRARVDAALESVSSVTTVIEVPLTTQSPGATTWSEFLKSGTGNTVSPGAPDRVAAFIHTGGTTGAPKLAQLSQRNLVAGSLMAASGLGFRNDDRIITGLPLFHVGGAVDVLLAAFAMGATVIFPTALGMRNPSVTSRIWKIIEENSVSILGCVPTTLAAAINTPLGDARLGTLRAIVTGGSPLPVALAKQVEQAIDRPICQLYGMTESSGIATAQVTDGKLREQTVGKPVPMMQIGIGQPSGPFEPGVRGEVFVFGPNVFHGYRTENGTEGVPEAGWFCTGDLGEVLPSGNLKIVGRTKDIIIRSGHNIDPLLIEDIAYLHPAIAQAAAVVMPDDYAGELPVLYVALRERGTVSEEELSIFMKEHIAEPPARPKHIFILPELPLTPIGKLARFRLRQLAVEHRVRASLVGIIDTTTVRCTDPSAKRVEIQSTTLGTVQQRQEIEKILATLGLELDTKAI